MNIQYFFRHPSVGFSIHRVFNTIIEEIKKNNKVSIFEVKTVGSMPWDIIKNIAYTIQRRKSKTIHHVTGHIHDIMLGLIGVKSILTIHDLVFLDNVNNPIKRFYKWLFWLYLPIKIADVVVCISDQTKKNILQHIKTNKLKVIPNPVDPKFIYNKKEFNKEKPIILHIGTGWNKNLETTIKALEDISCHLRIIGRVRPNQEILLKTHNIEYSSQQNLTDNEIIEEYVKCDIVNFPSFYEGFGMPIIEGQQTGRIVITSRIQPLLEVANQAAAFVNPEDVSSLKETYLKIIEEEEYRNNLIELGLKNAQRFTVREITKQYEELYKKLLKK